MDWFFGHLEWLPLLMVWAVGWAAFGGLIVWQWIANRGLHKKYQTQENDAKRDAELERLKAANNRTTS